MFLEVQHPFAFTCILRMGMFSILFQFSVVQLALALAQSAGSKSNSSTTPLNPPRKTEKSQPPPPPDDPMEGDTHSEGTPPPPPPLQGDKTLLAMRQLYKKMMTNQIRKENHMAFVKICLDNHKIPRGLQINVACNAFLQDLTNIKASFKET